MKETGDKAKEYKQYSQEGRGVEMAGKLEQAYSQYRSAFNQRA